jgi:hypothetical protein
MILAQSISFVKVAFLVLEYLKDVSGEYFCLICMIFLIGPPGEIKKYL